MNGDDRTFARPTQKIADMRDEELLERSRQLVNGFADQVGRPAGQASEPTQQGEAAVPHDSAPPRQGKGSPRGGEESSAPISSKGASSAEMPRRLGPIEGR